MNLNGRPTSQKCPGSLFHSPPGPERWSTRVIITKELWFQKPNNCYNRPLKQLCLLKICQYCRIVYWWRVCLSFWLFILPFICPIAFLWVRGRLEVTFAAIRLPRSEVQTSAMAEIWIEISALCTPRNLAAGTKNGTCVGPKTVSSQNTKKGFLVITPP